MGFSKTGINAVLFDYGNTLIAFGPAQLRSQNAALADTLANIFGNCDYARLKEIRDRQIRAPFKNGYRENNLRSINAELILGLYNIIPNERFIDALKRSRHESFTRDLHMTADLPPLLRKIGDKYKLGLVSNYPCGRSVRRSLSRFGLGDIFDTVVISGDVGYVKPHPKPFQTALSALGLPAGECLFVGDDWNADIQGAKKLGMQAILTSQYLPMNGAAPAPGDHEPDARIQHIGELESLLLD